MRLPLLKSFTSNLCCSRCPDRGESTTPVFYQTKPQFSSYPIGAFCVLPVWVFCSRLNPSLRLISLPSYPFHLQPLSPSLFSSSQLLILPHGGPFEELFSLWPITRVISSHSAPPLAGHHSAPPPGGTPNTSRQHNHPSRQAEGYERRHRDN